MHPQIKNHIRSFPWTANIVVSNTKSTKISGKKTIVKKFLPPENFFLEKNDNNICKNNTITTAINMYLYLRHKWANLITYILVINQNDSSPKKII
jgi:hypothetical protein